MTITLEKLLKTKVKSEDKDGKEIEVPQEFRVSVQEEFDRGVHFIIHPMDNDGETLDFVVSDDILTKL